VLVVQKVTVEIQRFLTQQKVQIQYFPLLLQMVAVSAVAVQDKPIPHSVTAVQAVEKPHLMVQQEQVPPIKVMVVELAMIMYQIIPQVVEVVLVL
jgi:hypothetical protein